MFEKLEVAPPDPVFGLLETFRNDPRKEKINLTIGVYQDASGQTPVLSPVRKAEEIMLQRGFSKSYLPIDGSAKYNQLVVELVLGQDHKAIAENRVVAVQTPGGTAALRIAGELLVASGTGRSILISDPTWANHPQIFRACRLNVKKWRYLDPSGTTADVTSLLEAIDDCNPGDGILLHAVCHNPTGCDYSKEQWREILAEVVRKKLVPVFDFAYQGFDQSIDSDAAVIREFCEAGNEAFVCSSFSKNFGLYAERTGCLIGIAASQAFCKPVLSQAKSMVRTMYSTPPVHGASIVETILANDDLRTEWTRDVAGMRRRIDGMRSEIVQRLKQLTGGSHFDFLNAQRGMFSFSGLTAVQAKQLRDDHAIYVVDNGRINVAGLNDVNVDRVVQAIASVTTPVGA